LNDYHIVAVVVRVTLLLVLQPLQLLSHLITYQPDLKSSG
jgi:hypothetical protein